MEDMYFYNKILHGEALDDVFILDNHMHLGKVNDFPVQCDDGQLVRMMDRCGVNAGCISSLLSLSEDFRKGNDEIRRLVKKYPGRFFGQIVINPNFPGEIRSELNRCWNMGGFRQIKIHPVFHQCDADDKKYLPVYQFASEKKISVLSHVWGVEQVKKFFNLAREYPDVIFILGHSGGEIPAQRLAVELANRYSNIVLDITGSWHYEGMIEFMVREAGEDRVVFGSDAVFLDIFPAIGRVGMAGIPRQAKEKVFGLNMKRVLGLT
ncbi:MAG: amidohydrolase family protein [Clostridiaceae bacterium]